MTTIGPRVPEFGSGSPIRANMRSRSATHNGTHPRPHCRRCFLISCHRVRAVDVSVGVRSQWTTARLEAGIRCMRAQSRALQSYLHLWVSGPLIAYLCRAVDHTTVLCAGFTSYRRPNRDGCRANNDSCEGKCDRNAM